MSSTMPDQHFEVPPEYAELYERAYRRAYAEGLGKNAEDKPAEPEGPSKQDPDARAPVPRVVVRPYDVDEARARKRAGGHRRRRTFARVGTIAGVLALLALLILAGTLLFRELFGNDGKSRERATTPVTTAISSSPTADETTAVPSASTASSEKSVYAGSLTPARVVTVQTTCIAPSGTDSDNQPVTYAAANMIDRDPASAWRCPGSAVGTTIRFSLPRTMRIAAVGLVPGYASTDVASGVDRYAENNRITAVRWTFDDGTSVVQKMPDRITDRSLRVERLVPVRTHSVEMTILEVARGTQNVTLISTVALSRPAG